MRLGYDAVTWQNIPSDAPFVLGYVDGNYAWPQEAWDHFKALGIPAATIAVETSTDANVLDCEPDNPVDPTRNPEDAVPWAQRQAHPVIYCSQENVPLMVAAFSAAGVPQPMYDVCDDTQSSHSWSGNGANVVSTQYNITDSVDFNLVADYWPGVDPAPAQSDPTPIESVPNMTMSERSDSKGVLGLSWSLGSAKDLQFITDGSLGTAPELRIVFLLTTGPLVIGNDNWVNGRVVIPLSGVCNPANCFGVIVEAQTNPGTPFWLYSNGS